MESTPAENNNNEGDNNNSSSFSSNLTPIPIPPPNTLNAIRSTYMNLFNQILDSSFNINCICKTTFKLTETSISAKTTLNTTNKCNIFDKGHNDFMSDDDEEDYETTPNYNGNCMNDKNDNDIEMQDNPLNDSQNRSLFSLDYMDQSNPNKFVNNKKLNKICDLSCFEYMRMLHSTFKNCFQNKTDEYQQLERFESIWESLKFLSKNPKSCDYYGSTLFHHAASDNQVDLLKCLVKKDPNGVFCIDSKGN